MLHGPLTNSGCMYTSYFTSTVTLEVKVEWSSDLRVEQSLEMEAERSSDLKSRAGWSSDLGVGWNLEQQKCEMGCPLTPSSRSGIHLCKCNDLAKTCGGCMEVCKGRSRDPGIPARV